MKLIDSHTHAEYFFQHGLEEEVRKRARESGVLHALNVGTGSKDWELYRSAVANFPDFYSYSVGLHPCHVDESWEQEVNHFADWAEKLEGPQPVAWGEMGLDYFHLPRDKAEADETVERQKRAFELQLQLVEKDKRPVIIHCREAFDDTIQMIDASGLDWSRFVFHCFTFGISETRKLLERGARASFTGIITYKNTESLRESMILQGLDLLMLETDAPWLSPNPMRGQKNEPAFLVHIAEEVASCFGVSPAQVGEVTTSNAVSFFRLPVG